MEAAEGSLLLSSTWLALFVFSRYCFRKRLLRSHPSITSLRACQIQQTSGMKWHEMCTVPSAWASASPASQPVRAPCAKAEWEAFGFLPGFWEQGRPFFQLTSGQAGLPGLACTSCWPRLRHLLFLVSLFTENQAWAMVSFKVTPANLYCTSIKESDWKGRDAPGSWCSVLSIVDGTQTTPHCHHQQLEVLGRLIQTESGLLTLMPKNNFGSSQFTKRSWRFY